ncbi:MAG TPA: OmpA family protein [Gammaproteobacteria bacterium]|nr:OmpA family protein [Gammaproteobacteria bacterium]
MEVIPDKKHSFSFSIAAIFVLIITVLQGCASSDVSRSATNEIQTTYQDASTAWNSDGVSVAQAYQGSSQRSKGILIGSATGAIIGAIASGWNGVLPGAAGGAIFGGALGAYIDSKTSLADQIINRGNKVIILGDQILIVLPSQHVFVANTSTLQPYSYKTLDLVSTLISGYPNMSVKITAYTGNIGPERINRSLTQEQADAVMKYLWRTKINTRLLYAEGGGGSKPVTETISDFAGDNYRVEITLEKLPV